MAEEDIIYDNIGRYLLGDSNSEYKLKNGLFVRGVVGCGKTLIFKMAQRYVGRNPIFKMVNTESLVSSFEFTDDFNYSKYLRGPWCFDDIGAEQKANNYGKATELIQRIINDRYDLWKFHGVITHFTTNLDNNMILEKYGKRTYDRIREMSNVIKMPGEKSNRGKSDVLHTNQISDRYSMTKEEKDAVILQTMESNFKELNDCFVKKLNSFGDLQGVRFYDTLKYFKLINYSMDKELWGNSKDEISHRASQSKTFENRQILGVLSNTIEADDKLIKKIKLSITTIYKGFLLKKFLKENRNFKDLYDARKEILKIK